jgi:hypothetical protein
MAAPSGTANLVEKRGGAMNRFLYPKTSLWIFLLLLLSVPALGQRGGADGLSESERAARREEASRRAAHRRLNDLAEAPANSPKGKPDFYNQKLTPAQKKLITPSPEERDAYREFLRQDHTGMIRLLPRGKYEFTDTVDVERDPELILPIRGGGAFYSFAEKTHAFGPWSELSLNDGLLITGFAGNSLGLLVPLGDVPLESVTPQSAGVDVLAQFTPPTRSSDATEARNRNFRSFKVRDFWYSSVLRALPNTTYVLRSMIYKQDSMIGPRTWAPEASEVAQMRLPFGYGGTDTLIAFRIVRANEDGSLTLLWKRLQKFQSPKLKKENRLAVVK